MSISRLLFPDRATEMPHQNSFPRIESQDAQELTAQEGSSAIEVESVLRASTPLIEEWSKNNIPRRAFISINFRQNPLVISNEDNYISPTGTPCGHIILAVQTRLINAQAFITRSIMQLQGCSSARRRGGYFIAMPCANSLQSLLDAVPGFDG